MGIKSTSRITRQQALEILLSEIPSLPNDALGDLMDCLAECGYSKVVSKFDNFIVSNIVVEGTPDMRIEDISDQVY